MLRNFLGSYLRPTRPQGLFSAPHTTAFSAIRSFLASWSADQTLPPLLPWDNEGSLRPYPTRGEGIAIELLLMPNANEKKISISRISKAGK